MKQLSPALWVLAVMLAVPTAFAHGDKHVKKSPAAATAEQTDFGIAGDAKAVTRTIRFVMSDAMRFDPALVRVRQGETVKFVLHNNGNLMHEMVIGTMTELKAHAELMRKFPDMEHDEAYMAHVSPGKTGEIVWTFNRTGEFHFACLVAGHFEAGMVGKVIVASAQ